MSASHGAARAAERPSLSSRPSRRGFIASLSALAVVGALPGCGDDGSTPEPLEQFIALSILLTGFDELSEPLAQTYLDALQADPDVAAALDDLYAEAGLGSDDAAESFEALSARGVFDDPRLTDASDTVIRLWYTGVVDGPDGPLVVAYTDNLAWGSLDYATPPSVCGGLVDFWAEPPAAA